MSFTSRAHNLAGGPPCAGTDEVLAVDRYRHTVARVSIPC